MGSNVVKSVVSPLMGEAADVIRELADVFTNPGAAANIGKILKHAQDVSKRLDDTRMQLSDDVNAAETIVQRPTGARLKLLTYFENQPSLKVVGRGRLTPAGIEYIMFYQTDVWVMTEGTVTKNSDEVFETPSWIKQMLRELSQHFRLPEFMPITNSMFLGAVGSILRGQV